MTPRRVAFFAYPGLTTLDLVGGYDALRRVPSMGVDTGVSCHVIGLAPEVGDGWGLTIRCEAVMPALSPDRFDLLFVPGGRAAAELCEDPAVVDYLASWGRERPIASVCNGALLLGRAGHLKGLRATTHASSFDALAPLCREVVRGQRVVDEGRVVTAAGVSASIDLGLHLVAKYWGEAARERIARQMEVPPAT
jgi:cyclohexyl-isocyanide hydratase